MNTNNLAYFSGAFSDEIFEALPSQLLPLLREDSLGVVVRTDNQLLVQFTGNDLCAYAIEVSSNLVNWTSVITNYPSNGTISFIGASPNSNSQFYRSVLLP